MISLKNVNYSYKNKSPLFQDLSIDFVPGKIIGLFGKNGSGKTSLLKLLGGLLFQDSGNLSVLNLKPKERKPSLLENIFLIPEEIYLPSITINQYIIANRQFYPTFDQALQEELLEQCELSNSDLIQELSYGQKKKLLITFALATKCRLILLDEPTNGLDIPSKAVFRKIVAGSLDERQLVIISTHQVKDIENLIDGITILDQGRVLLSKDLYQVSSKLHFSHKTSLEDHDILYHETTLDGFKVITPSMNGNSSVDLELLFNAVVSGKKLFKSYENN